MEASELKNVAKSGKSPQFSWSPLPQDVLDFFLIWEKLDLIWEKFEIGKNLNFGNTPLEKKKKLEALEIA